MESSAIGRSLSYEQWMTAAAEEYDRLLRLLLDLRAEQWQAPTDCSGWAVRDVVAHLAGAAAGTASIRELLRQARLGRRLGGGGDLVDRMNDVQVRERAAFAPEALVHDLEESGRRGVGARRRIPRPLRSVPLPFGPPLGTRSLGYLMGRIYTRDAWMHRIDLAYATGTRFELTVDHDAAIVEDVVAEWAGTHGRDFDLRLGGPAGGHWTRRTSRVVDEVSMDAVEFARTMSGRVPGEGLLAHRVPF